MVKTQTKIPLTRPIFTEEAQKTKHNKGPLPHGNEKMATDLLRLEKLPIATGNVTVQMMEEFKCFPWTQNTMLMVGQLDVALREFLEEHLDIDEDTLEK